MWFTIKTLYLLPSISEICQYKNKHINATRGLCHGNILQGYKVAFATHVFATLKDFILDNLQLWFSISPMMAKHLYDVQELVETSGNLTKDNFLCEQDIQNITRKQQRKHIRNMKMMSRVLTCGLKRTQTFCFIIRRLGLKLVERYQEVIVLFTIGIQTTWHVTMMQPYGHQSAVAINATFETNENKVNYFIVTQIVNPSKPLKHNER